jgi:ElaA protein
MVYLMEKLNWILKGFSELIPEELYAILRLRSLVFVVEQQCVFLDMDNLDQPAYHLMGWEGDKLVAYTRLLDKGTAYPGYPSIGRVVTSPDVRGTGIGRLLMQESIRQVENLFGRQPIKIGAQYYLKSFYGSLGFEQAGDIYLEDGIEHIPMIRP